MAVAAAAAAAACWALTVAQRWQHSRFCGQLACFCLPGASWQSSWLLCCTPQLQVCRCAWLCCCMGPVAAESALQLPRAGG